MLITCFVTLFYIAEISPTNESADDVITDVIWRSGTRRDAEGGCSDKRVSLKRRYLLRKSVAKPYIRKESNEELTSVFLLIITENNPPTHTLRL